MNVGDVFWVEFPPRGGHAQSGRRPAIVAQEARVSDRLPTVLVVPLTSQLDALRFPGTVLVGPDAENGLRRPSVALVFQLAAVDRRFLTQQAGRATSEIVGQLWEALDGLTGRSTA